MTATSAIDGGSLSDELIISAALTGSWPTKAQNPALPVTEKEISHSTLACAAAGSGSLMFSSPNGHVDPNTGDDVVTKIVVDDLVWGPYQIVS